MPPNTQANTSQIVFDPPFIHKKTKSVITVVPHKNGNFIIDYATYSLIGMLSSFKLKWYPPSSATQPIRLVVENSSWMGAVVVARSAKVSVAKMNTTVSLGRRVEYRI